MGCDIHINVEVQQFDGKWRKAIDESVCYKMRNYELFGFLAGVRGSLEPVKEPDGLPHDLSSEVKTQFKLEQAHHTATSYTLKELMLVLEDCPSRLFADFVEWVDSCYALTDFSNDQIRFIIWFDS